jgi:5-deoxy-5-amino-3-dehydroquinate synthase
VTTDPGPQSDITVPVELGERRYDVIIGSGVRHRLAAVVAATGARRAAVVSARPKEWTPDPGVPTTYLAARDGEEEKTLAGV